MEELKINLTFKKNTYMWWKILDYSLLVLEWGKTTTNKQTLVVLLANIGNGQADAAEYRIIDIISDQDKTTSRKFPENQNFLTQFLSEVLVVVGPAWVQSLHKCYQSHGPIRALHIVRLDQSQAATLFYSDLPSTSVQHFIRQASLNNVSCNTGSHFTNLRLSEQNCGTLERTPSQWLKIQEIQ